MNNRKILKGQSLILFNKILFIWITSIFIISAFGYIFSVDVTKCSVYSYLQIIAPSIESWSSSTKHQEIMRLIWAYMTLSGPIVFILMFKYINLIKVNHLKRHEIFLYLVLFILFFYSSFIGILDGEIPSPNSYRFARLYYYSLFWSICFVT